LNAATSSSASAISEGSNLSAGTPNHARIPILYVILSVLVLISVVPMYFYSAHVQSNNRNRLIPNERLMQNTVTRSFAHDISKQQDSLRLLLASLASAIQIASGGDMTGQHI